MRRVPGSLFLGQGPLAATSHDSSAHLQPSLHNYHLTRSPQATHLHISATLIPRNKSRPRILNMASRAQAFRDWATAEQLTITGPIDQLQDKRIVVDAEDFLENILTSQATREPLLPALGGLPFALRKHLDLYLAKFKEANITLTFVFNGLDLACRDRQTLSRESKQAARSLDQAWSLYSQSRADEAVAEFGKSCM